MIQFELVPDCRAINAEIYCEQLERIYSSLQEKYPTFVKKKLGLFLQDNA